jgi:cell division transport system permease protein
MTGWLAASPADRRLLSGRPMLGPTPWVVAIMAFSIVLIAACGLALANSASVLTRAIEARYSLEVPGGGDRIDAIATVVRATPGASGVEVVAESTMRRTLSRWLGSAAQSRDLPVPALINFDMKPGVSPVAVEFRVRQLAPDAKVIAHRDSVAPLLHSLRVLIWVALGLVLLLGAAAASAVVLAARGALDTQRSTIEVMHGIGATDVQITQLFQRRIALDALAGSLAGTAAAAIVLIVLGSGAAFAGELANGPLLHWGDILLLLLLPFVLTALATGVARAALLSALRADL